MKIILSYPSGRYTRPQLRAIRRDVSMFLDGDVDTLSLPDDIDARLVGSVLPACKGDEVRAAYDALGDSGMDPGSPLMEWMRYVASACERRDELEI